MCLPSHLSPPAPASPSPPSASWNQRPPPHFRGQGAGDELAWALDDRDATFTNVSGGIASYQPEPALTTGTHVLTLASQGPGWLRAIAVGVQVVDH